MPNQRVCFGGEGLGCGDLSSCRSYTSVPAREAGLRMMNEITDALVLTYDELNRSMPPSWSDDAGNEFQLVDYIDPLVAMPLSGLEDTLQFD